MSFLKFIFWLIVIGGVVYGGYYVYTQWFGEGEIKVKDISLDVLKEKIGRKAGQYAIEVASTTETKVKSGVKEAIGDIIASVGEKIYSAGLNLAGVNSSSSLFLVSNVIFEENQVAAPTSSSFYFPPPSAAIITKINNPFYFSINSGQKYKVDWGDNVEEEGEVKTGNITILNHIWAKAGDYLIQVNIDNDTTGTAYSFPIRVY